MKRNTTLIALALALAVNTAALAGLNQAMSEGGQRAELAQIEPARVVVTAKKLHDGTTVAKHSRGGSRS